MVVISLEREEPLPRLWVTSTHCLVCVAVSFLREILVFAFILLKLFFPEALAQILGARSLGTPEQHILLRLESPCLHPELLSLDQACAQGPFPQDEYFPGGLLGPWCK